MPYTPFYPGGWKDFPNTTTPIVAAALQNMETGIGAGVALDATAADIQPAGTQAAGAVGKAADAGHVHPLGLWQPSDNGLLLAIADPASTGSSQLNPMVAGTIYLTRFVTRQAMTISKLWLMLTTAG